MQQADESLELLQKLPSLEKKVHKLGGDFRFGFMGHINDEEILAARDY